MASRGVKANLIQKSSLEEAVFEPGEMEGILLLSKGKKKKTNSSGKTNKGEQKQESWAIPEK